MISFHPAQGSILICDFTAFREPEMTKRRPVIVVSKPIVARPGLCTVVPLGSGEPEVLLPMHYKIIIDTPLPPPYNDPFHWVKGDMIYALGFDRLFLPYRGKIGGKRDYDCRVISSDQLARVQKCIMAGIGIMKY